MTRKEALAELIANTKNGIWIPETKVHVWELNTDLLWKAYNGSLDAALALHEAVLPSARVHDLSQFERGWSCVLNGDIPPHFFYGDADTPARAWLLAILKALHEMETEQ